MRVYAIPLGDNYWFSADWGIHKRVKLISKLEETTEADAVEEELIPSGEFQR